MYNPNLNPSFNPQSQGQKEDFYIPTTYHFNPQEENQQGFSSGAPSSAYNPNSQISYDSVPPTKYDPTFSGGDIAQPVIYDPSVSIGQDLSNPVGSVLEGTPISSSIISGSERIYDKMEDIDSTSKVDSSIVNTQPLSSSLSSVPLISTPLTISSSVLTTSTNQSSNRSHLSNLSPSDIFSLLDADFARLGPKTSIPIPSQSSLSLGVNDLPDGFEKQRHEPDTRNYNAEQTVEYISSISTMPNSGNSLLNIQYGSIDEKSGIIPLTATNPERGSELEVPLSSACDPNYVDELMASKKMFDQVAAHLFTAARRRSNPYETLSSSALHQRSAIKMANIDAETGVSTQIELLQEENEILYYCDLNGENGGFVEYICWKYKTYGSKGWGMTPKSGTTYQLNKFSPDAPYLSFVEVFGKDDSGNIMIEENRQYLNSIINSGTDNRGVALCLSDGSVTVPSQENRQEILARKVLLSECLTALTVLRKGGNFVCKFYDTFTTFTASLLYILFQEFEEISIFKPLASRPASSEKYIICKKLKQRNPPITKIMYEAMEKLLQGVNVVSLVDQSKIRSNSTFHEYLKRKNIEFAREQLYFLDRIKKCIEDIHLELGETQRRLAKECATRWAVPEPSHRQNRTRGGNGGYRGGRGRGNNNRGGLGRGSYQGYRGGRGGGGNLPRPPQYIQHANISGVRAYGDMSSYDTPATPFAQSTPKPFIVSNSNNPRLSKQEQIEMMRSRHK